MWRHLTPQQPAHPDTQSSYLYPQGSVSMICWSHGTTLAGFPPLMCRSSQQSRSRSAFLGSSHSPSPPVQRPQFSDPKSMVVMVAPPQPSRRPDTRGSPTANSQQQQPDYAVYVVPINDRQGYQYCNANKNPERPNEKVTAWRRSFPHSIGIARPHPGRLSPPRRCKPQGCSHG